MEQALTEGRISRTLWKDFREKSKEEKIKSPYETGKMNLIKPIRLPFFLLLQVWESQPKSSNRLELSMHRKNEVRTFQTIFKGV